MIARAAEATESPRETLIKALAQAGWLERETNFELERFREFHHRSNETFVFLYEDEALFGTDDRASRGTGYKSFEDALAIVHVQSIVRVQ